MDADAIIRRYEALREDRRHHESAWEEQARLFDPGREGFTLDPRSTRDKARAIGVYSSDPIMAANSLRSGLYGTLANQATPWFSLTVPDADLADRKAVRLWLDKATSIVLASFRPAVSSFYPRTIQALGDTTIFGNAAAYDEIDVDAGRIVDLAIPLGEIVIARDAHDALVETIRKFTLTAQQIKGKWPTAALPPAMEKAIERGDTTRFVIYHYVTKNDDWRPGRLGAKGKAFASIYVAEAGKTDLSRGGYEEMPYTYPGWDRVTGETYARGAAYVAAPAARVLNLMEAANLEAGERAARPTILAPHRQALQYAMNPRPGAVLYGAMMNGRAQIAEFSPTRGTGLTLEMAAQKVDQVKDAFYWSLMQMAGRTGMTATEVVERQAEKLRLMAPHLGNLQVEYFAPKVARRFAMLWRAGQIPPPPEEMEGQALDVDYQSAAALAAKSAEGAGVMRLLEDIGPLMQLDPRYKNRIDPDGVIEVLHAARGVPARVLRSRDEADAIAQAEAEAAQAQEQMAALQQGAGIAKDMAGAMSAMPMGGVQ